MCPIRPSTGIWLQALSFYLSDLIHIQPCIGTEYIQATLWRNFQTNSRVLIWHGCDKLTNVLCLCTFSFAQTLFNYSAKDLWTNSWVLTCNKLTNVFAGFFLSILCWCTFSFAQIFSYSAKDFYPTHGYWFAFGKLTNVSTLTPMKTYQGCATLMNCFLQEIPKCGSHFSTNVSLNMSLFSNFPKFSEHLKVVKNGPIFWEKSLKVSTFFCQNDP